MKTETKEKRDRYAQFDDPNAPCVPNFFGSQHSHTCGLVKDTQGYVQAKQCYNPTTQQDMDAVVRKMYWGL
jgi:hypothetical protein